MQLVVCTWLLEIAFVHDVHSREAYLYVDNDRIAIVHFLIKIDYVATLRNKRNVYSLFGY